MKFVALVNGVPASGKSALARALADRTGWPLFVLDTVKEALFAHLGVGDRLHNRRFGQASYQAIFAVIGDWPAGSVAIVDAWFGFQPEETLRAHLARAGVDRVAQLWCAAPPEVIGARYLARLAGRAAGHLGAEYAPELIELAKRARPIENFATLTIDTTMAGEITPVVDWVLAQRGRSAP